MPGQDSVQSHVDAVVTLPTIQTAKLRGNETMPCAVVTSLLSVLSIRDLPYEKR